MTERPLDNWRGAFLQVIQEPATAAPLKEASLSANLTEWTTLLTAAVVQSCESLGWQAAAKGHPLDLLPQWGQEYLGIDVMAFAAKSGTQSRWPLPAAAFELENSPQDDRVAYSLWKVLCLRVPLRIVFAYRDDWHKAKQLVANLQQEVIGSLSIEERQALEGETALVTGSRSEGATFPWGYFKFWVLETNTGHFEKV